MHMLSKVIAFPVSSKRSGRCSAVAFPRFAVAFGDRDTAPLSIERVRLTLRLPNPVRDFQKPRNAADTRWVATRLICGLLKTKGRQALFVWLALSCPRKCW